MVDGPEPVSDIQLGALEWIEGWRGNIAAWALVSCGLVYTAWGLRALQLPGIGRRSGAIAGCTITLCGLSLTLWDL